MPELAGEKRNSSSDLLPNLFVTKKIENTSHDPKSFLERKRLFFCPSTNKFPAAHRYRSIEGSLCSQVELKNGNFGANEASLIEEKAMTITSLLTSERNRSLMEMAPRITWLKRKLLCLLHCSLFFLPHFICARSRKWNLTNPFTFILLSLPLREKTEKATYGYINYRYVRTRLGLPSPVKLFFFRLSRVSTTKMDHGLFPRLRDLLPSSRKSNRFPPRPCLRDFRLTSTPYFQNLSKL